MLWFYNGVTISSKGMPKTLSSYDDMQFTEDITSSHHVRVKLLRSGFTGAHSALESQIVFKKITLMRATSTDNVSASQS
jgi:hypothetical protein